MWMSGSFTTWPDHRAATGLTLGGFPRGQLSEVVGNLEVLEDEGRVRRVTEGPVERWARA